jgi:hypothetical protein
MRSLRPRSDLKLRKASAPLGLTSSQLGIGQMTPSKPARGAGLHGAAPSPGREQSPSRVKRVRITGTQNRWPTRFADGSRINSLETPQKWIHGKGCADWLNSLETPLVHQRLGALIILDPYKAVVGLPERQLFPPIDPNLHLERKPSLMRTYIQPTYGWIWHCYDTAHHRNVSAAPAWFCNARRWDATPLR